MALVTEFKISLTRIASEINKKAKAENSSFRVTKEEISDWFFGANSVTSKHDAGTFGKLRALESIASGTVVAKSKSNKD